MPGVVLVLATSNRVAVQTANDMEHVAQGDYEVVVQLTAVSRLQAVGMTRRRGP
jgi:hypothetical protein